MLLNKGMVFKLVTKHQILEGHLSSEIYVVPHTDIKPRAFPKSKKNRSHYDYGFLE